MWFIESHLSTFCITATPSSKASKLTHPSRLSPRHHTSRVLGCVRQFCGCLWTTFIITCHIYRVFHYFSYNGYARVRQTGLTVVLGTMLDFEGHLNRCDVYTHVKAPGMNMVDETMGDEGDLQGFRVQGSRCGFLLYRVCVGREGIEGGDKLEHRLAWGRQERLGDGEWLRWLGQLPGRLLGDIDACRVIGFG